MKPDEMAKAKRGPLARLAGAARRLAAYLNIPALHAEIAALKSQIRQHRCSGAFVNRPTPVIITADDDFGPDCERVLCRIEYGEAPWPTERGSIPVKGFVLSPSEYQQGTELARLLKRRARDA